MSMIGTDPRLEIVLTAKEITGPAFKKVTGYAKNLSREIFSLNGVLGLAAGAGGMGLLIKQNLAAADAIGKTAAKLGVSTTALQEYRYMAERSGVATKTLDMGMQRFTRRLAEAAQGKGELKEVLEQYGIAVRDANGQMRQSEAVFNNLADAIQGAESDSEKLRIAFKAFDSEGAAMVNMLRDGSRGLDDLRGRYERLGITIEEDFIRKSAEAKDNLDDLTKVISTSFTRAVVAMAPEIGTAAGHMATWVAENKVFLTQDVPGHVRTLAGGVKDLANIYSALPDYITGPAGMGIVGTALLGRTPGKVIFVVSALNALLHETGNGLQDLVDKHYASGQAMIDLWNSIADAVSGGTKAMDFALKSSHGDVEVPKIGQGDLGTVTVTAPTFDPSITAETRAQFWRESHTKLMADMQRMNADIVDAHLAEAIEPVMTAEKIAAETRAKFWRQSHEQRYADMQRMNADVQAANDLIVKDTEEAASMMERAFDGWANSFSQNISDMVWDAEMGFGNILESFGRMITQMMIQEKIVEPVFAGLKGFDLGSLFDFSGGASAAPAANIGYAPSFATGGVFGNISGHSNQVVSSPTAFDFSGLKTFASGGGLMGEAGPEAIMPLTRLSGGDLGVKAQATQVNVYVQNNTSAKTEVRETPNSAGGKDIIIMIDDALGGMVRSNRGKLASALNSRGARPALVGR